jgi:predicted AAA+ superfamily ATPase
MAFNTELFNNLINTILSDDGQMGNYNIKLALGQSLYLLFGDSNNSRKSSLNIQYVPIYETAVRHYHNTYNNNDFIIITTNYPM